MAPFFGTTSCYLFLTHRLRLPGMATFVGALPGSDEGSPSQPRRLVSRFVGRPGMSGPSLEALPQSFLAFQYF